jgi:hypothetical protein
MSDHSFPYLFERLERILPFSCDLSIGTNFIALSREKGTPLTFFLTYSTLSTFSSFISSF